jgi:hypothetical protein
MTTHGQQPLLGEMLGGADLPPRSNTSMVSPTLILTQSYHFQLNYLVLFRKGFFNILEI